MSKFISPISHLFSRVREDEKGTQLVETAIWLGIITAGAVAAVVAIAPQVTAALTRVQTALGQLN